MTSILYISYTGLLDPLGQSQVLQYVRALAASHQISVLSFEKPQALADTARVQELKVDCEAEGIAWHPRVWHNRPIGAMATAFDLLAGSRHAIRLARAQNVQVVHCRSYIAGLMGLAVKRATGARYVFDMRGFWPDERVDGGIWSKGSLNYRLFKRAERILFLGANHVVSLTKAGIREFERFDYLQEHMPASSVIPTCTNLDLFRAVESPREGFTLGYVGSVGSWYLFHAVAKAVALAFEKRSDARFLVVTQGSHDIVRKALQHASVDLQRVEITTASFTDVPSQIARMDAGLFFIRPAWSKRASCPTRMGEFLACGKPCLTNGGVGDVAEDLHETGTGIALPPEGDYGVDLTNLNAALETIFAMTDQPDIVERCRDAAEARFSLSAGVAEYDRIYRHLAKEPLP